MDPQDVYTPSLMFPSFNDLNLESDETRSASPLMRRNGGNSRSSVSPLIGRGVQVASSTQDHLHLPVVQRRVLSQHATGDLVVFFTDSEQDTVHYNICLRVAKRLVRAVVLAIYNSRDETDASVRVSVVFGGDTYGIQDLSPINHRLTNTVTTELAKTTNGRIGTNQVVYTNLVGGRDVSMLCILFEIPHLTTHLSNKFVIFEMLKIPPMIYDSGAGMSNHYMVPYLLMEHMFAMRANDATPSKLILLVWIKLVLLVNNILRANYKHKSHMCGDYCGGFLQHFISKHCRDKDVGHEQFELLTFFRHTSHQNPNESMDDYVSRMWEWIMMHCVDAVVVDSAHQICDAVVQWIGGNEDDAPMRKYLMHSKMISHLENDDYRLLSTHAGLKDIDGNSVMYKFPRGFVESTKPQVIWTDFVLSDSQKFKPQELIDEWCDAFNGLFKHMIAHTYSAYDEPAFQQQNFVHEFETPFHNTPAVTLNFYELTRTLMLLVPIQSIPNANPFTNTPDHKKPCVWFEGNDPHPVARLIYDHRDQFCVKTDTQFYRPSFAVSGTCDKLALQPTMATMTQWQHGLVINHLSWTAQQTQRWTNQHSEFISRPDVFRVTCGPSVCVTHSIISNDVDPDPEMHTKYLRGRLLTIVKHANLNDDQEPLCYITVVDEQMILNDLTSLTKYQARKQNLKNATIFAAGALCVTIAESEDMQNGSIIALHSNEHLSELLSYASDIYGNQLLADNANVPPLQQITTGHQFGKTWRIPIPTLDDTHMLLMSYACSSDDTLWGAEITWSTRNAKWKCIH